MEKISQSTPVTQANSDEDIEMTSVNLVLEQGAGWGCRGFMCRSDRGCCQTPSEGPVPSLTCAGSSAENSCHHKNSSLHPLMGKEWKVHKKVTWETLPQDPVWMDGTEAPSKCK